MKIDELLNKYFEGETSCEEERELRRFFTEEAAIPEHLQMYRLLFACIDKEAKEHQSLTKEAENKEPKSRNLFPRRLCYTLGGVAAGLLVLIGIANLYRHIAVAPTDYVVINGKRYTDVNIIREQALSAFQDVSMSQEEVIDLMFE